MLEKFIPDLHVDSVYQIDIQSLWRSGVRGIITDLDNTLAGARAPDAGPELLEWLERVRRAGFLAVIVSNNREARVSRFAKPIGLPYIHRAKKPANRSFLDAMKLMGTSRDQTVMIGDQLLTDIFGGNRMGMKTILVTPISLRDESFFTKINRKLEKIAMYFLRKNGRLPWEDQL